MTHTWSWSWLFSLTALVLLTIATMCPPSWSQDLTVRENEYVLTPVSDLQEGPATRQNILPATYNGPTTVESLQSLEQRTASSEEKKNNPHQPVNPVSLSPAQPAAPLAISAVPVFAVFPVLVHASMDKAFSDAPVVLSTAVANQLLEQARQKQLHFGVLNPIHSYDDLKEKGLDGIYNKLVRDYMEAGLPNERDLLYLADQLSTPHRYVNWVVFVEADFDTHNMTRPSGVERALRTLIDQDPREANFFLSGSIEIFAVREGTPLLANKTASTRLKMSKFGNFTKSVFDDSDTSLNFKMASIQLAQSLTSSLPKETYTTRTNVEAALIPQQGENINPATISQEDQEALKRILQPQ